MQVIITCFALLLGLVSGAFFFYFWFTKLSAKALLDNNQSFLNLAQTGFLSPFKDSLSELNLHLRELEKNREGAYQTLQQQVLMLKTETASLARALSSHSTRGRWGEIQLKRVVELAGMVAHCDFEEQVVKTTDSETIRPDLVIKLPGNKCVVVDSKVPLSAYLRAMESEDQATQNSLFNEHADQLKKHIGQLSKKSYWKHFQPSPEFVVLFLPGETFLSTALSLQPELMELAAENNVILATPMTLIAMLRAIAFGWRQEASNENAQRIAQKAKELCERLNTLAEYFSKLGKSLGQSVESYNQAMASLESRVLVSARQMTDMGEFGAGNTIKTIEVLEKTPTC
jgi:DNA recombination protein RmuC